MRPSPWRATALALVLGGAGALAACDDAWRDAGGTSARALGSTREATSPRALRKTLDDLAAIANEGGAANGFAPGIRVGSPQGRAAAAYLGDRFRAMGFPSVVEEKFHFPQHKVAAGAKFQFAGAKAPIAFDVFEGSGSGKVVDADVVWVGTAKPADLAGVDLRGKIALVRRDTTFHRSSQYRNVTAAGAAAMLYISEAANNQIQIGSVRASWEPLGSIPAITIGRDDGTAIRDALAAAAGSPEAPRARASIIVAASSERATGQNVIATLPGQDRTHRLVIGAHYDTWYTGSVDNGGGVAALLALAELAALRSAPPAYELVFVAYDGEEVGLYGGYDYLRRHQDEGILTVLNLEMPSTKGEDSKDAPEPLRGIATSKAAALSRSIEVAVLAGDKGPYPLWLPLDYVAQVFGGIIPTDIQGAYRSGLPTLSTATDSPYYHTPSDTPDKVDVDFLGRGAARFDALLRLLLAEPRLAFTPEEPALWDADLAVSTAADGAILATTRIFARDAQGVRGKPVSGTAATFTLFCDDFFAEPDASVTTDGSGRAAATFQPPSTCSGNRFVHVSAGKTYPLVEKVARAREIPAER
jgi:hypothetical protein